MVHRFKGLKVQGFGGCILITVHHLAVIAVATVMGYRSIRIMTKEYKHLETKLIHAGEPDPLICGAVSMPVFQSSTFECAGEPGYYNLKYIRLNNTPNHVALHQKLAASENAEAALVTASGMAAISSTLLTLLGAGDHLLAQDCLYGGTHDFIIQDLPALGISFDFIDGNAPDSWKSKRSIIQALRAIAGTNEPRNYLMVSVG